MGSRVAAAEVIKRLKLTPEEFDWPALHGRSTTEEDLVGRVEDAIDDASLKTEQRVGTTNYTSTASLIARVMRKADFYLSCANMLRQRFVILASRPEEAPPAEYIDLDALDVEIKRLERDWLEAITPYVTEDADMRGGFSFSGAGVDETEEDYTGGDYSDLDYGELPS